MVGLAETKDKIWHSSGIWAWRWRSTFGDVTYHQTKQDARLGEKDAVGPKGWQRA